MNNEDGRMWSQEYRQLQLPSISYVAAYSLLTNGPIACLTCSAYIEPRGP